MSDTAKIWANVLKQLRENKETSLFAVCGDVKTEFTPEKIIITPQNTAAATIFKKNLLNLKKYAGGEYIEITKSQTETPTKETVEKLKKIFGDKLVVV